MTEASSPGRILLLGVTGQVGHDLAQVLPTVGPVVAPRRSELDLTDLDAVRRAVRATAPGVIVNAAAWTDVEGAELDEPGAMALNAALPRVLAEEAEARGALLVHYSTDYVFDGRAGRPLHEADLTAPLNAYGRSKAAGEAAIMAVGGQYLILRLSWVYSPRRRNFFKAIAERAARGEPLRVVDDQIGTPTWSRAIAEATAGVLQQIGDAPQVSRGFVSGGSVPGGSVSGGSMSGGLASGGDSGIYHMSSGEACSWADFADAIVGGVKGATAEPVTRISSGEFQTRAARPAYSVLAVDKLASTFGLRLPPWRQQLQECLAEASSSEAR